MVPISEWPISLPNCASVRLATTPTVIVYVYNAITLVRLVIHRVPALAATSLISEPSRVHRPAIVWLVPTMMDPICCA